MVDDDLLALIGRLHNTKQHHHHCIHLLNNNNSCGDNENKYALVIPAGPAIGILYVTKASKFFISGHVRMRGIT